MNTARSHTPTGSLKTPVFILGPGLQSRLSNSWGLKNVRDFTKGNTQEKLLIALRESPMTQSVVILPRAAFEKNDTFRRALTQIKEEFPHCLQLVLRYGGMEDSAMIDNDKKAGATDVLWHSSQSLTEADYKRIVTFVVQGVLPRPEANAQSAQAPATALAAKPGATSSLSPQSGIAPGKSLSTQELLHQVIAGQGVLQAQNEAILRRLDQIHGIASGALLAQIKELYPKILEVFAYEEH